MLFGYFSGFTHVLITISCSMIPRDVVCVCRGVSIKGAQYKILMDFYDILLKGRFQPTLAYGCPAYMCTMYVHTMCSKKYDNITPIFAAEILI